MFENRVLHILDNDYAPKSAVAIFTKDLEIVSDMARAASFPTPIAGSALQMFLMTAASGMGHDDDASIARLYAKIAGTSSTAPTPLVPHSARTSSARVEDRCSSIERGAKDELSP